MHYGLWDASIFDFKIEETKTIKVLPEYKVLTPEQEEKIGNVKDLSETDKDKVKFMYGCYGVFLFFLLITISFGCNYINGCRYPAAIKNFYIL